MGNLKAVNSGLWIVDRKRGKRGRLAPFVDANFLPRALRGRIKVGALIFFALIAAFAPRGHAEKPARIVSMNLCSDELVVRLADPERIAALTYFAADPSISNISEEAKQFHLIRSQAEEVMSLNPDLVFAGMFTDRAAKALLQRMGYEVRILELPQDFEGIRKNIREVAEALGEPERGRALIAQMDETLQTLSSVKSVPLPKVLFYQRGGFTPGAETFEDAIIREAGAKNLSAADGIRHYGVLPLEALIAAQPDYVIFSEFDRTRLSVGGWLLEHPALRHARHIRTVTIPGRWLNCGGPLSVEAVRALRKAFDNGNKTA